MAALVARPPLAPVPDFAPPPPLTLPWPATRPARPWLLSSVAWRPTGDRDRPSPPQRHGARSAHSGNTNIQPGSRVRIASSTHVHGGGGLCVEFPDARFGWGVPTGRDGNRPSPPSCDCDLAADVLATDPAGPGRRDDLLSPHCVSPPPYGVEDPPPPYAILEPRARASVVLPGEKPMAPVIQVDTGMATHDTKIDLDHSPAIRTRGKKAKKAAKAAQESKWFGADNEGEENAGTEGGDGGDGDGGGGDKNGSAGGGGGGDDNNNNGNGGDDDDWDYGGNKKNKKKKKKQEEEERKRLEEEEQKKKEDDEQKANNSLNWADEVNAAADDDWAAGFTTTTKKDKKKKTKKVRSISVGEGGVMGLTAQGVEDADPTTTAFHDINLDDTAPKLDFSLGDSDIKKDSGAFGAWGKTWDFGALDSGTAKVDDKTLKKDDKKGGATDFADTNPWSLTNKSKKKTTTISSGFDFDLDAGDTGFTMGDVGPAKNTDDAWGFSTFNKKDKKKKSIVEEKEEDPPVVPEPEAKEDDTWGAWGTAASKKTKKKKGAVDEAALSPPPAVPHDAAPAADEDDKFAFVTKKDKKKGKKAGLDDGSSETKDAPLDLGTADAPFDWGSGTKSKDKKDLLSDSQSKADDADDWMSAAWGKKKDKKGKKGALVEEVPVPAAVPDAAPEADDVWGSFGKKDKKEKKGKTSGSDALMEDLILEDDAKPDVTPDGYADTTGWDELTPKERKKKEKEAKKKGLLIPEGPSTTAAVPAKPAEEEDDLAMFPVATKDKKSKKKGFLDLDDESTEPPKSDPPTLDDDSWAFGLTAKEKKKKEKELKKNKDIPNAEAEADLTPAPDVESKDVGGWSEFGFSSAKDKKKKDKDAKKKGTADPSEDPQVVEEDFGSKAKDDDVWDTWGTVSSKDKKKKEKDAAKKAEEAAVPAAGAKKSELEPVAEKADNIWSPWGATKEKKATKDKKKDAIEAENLDPPKTEAVEDDIWGAWSTKDKKGSKKSKREEPPPPVPSPPAQGLTPEPDAMDMLEGDLGLDTWGSFAPKGKTSTKKSAGSKAATEVETSKEKEKKTKEASPVAESTPLDDEMSSKAIKSSIWGFGSTTTTSKLTKKDKDAKAKKEAEELAKREEEEKLAKEAEETRLAEEARLAEEEEAARNSKKKGGKASKTDTKDSKASKTKTASDLVDVLDDEPPASKSEKSSKAKTIKEKDGDKKTDDYFGFWGSAATSKKTAGKKDVDAKREITKQGATNKDEALGDTAQMNDFDLGMDRETPADSSKTSKTAMTTKSKLSSSVAERIKALEGNSKKDETAKKTKTEGLLTKASPHVDDALSPKEEKKLKDKDKTSTTKAKATSTLDSKTTKKKSDASPAAADEKKSKDSVPGSFPGAFGDDADDLLGLEPSSMSPPKSKSKSKAEATKGVKTKAATPKDSKSKNLDLAADDPKAAKQSASSDEKKVAKKERPKVERSATSSWGFWGTVPPPKKSTKEKSHDEADVPSDSKKDRRQSVEVSRTKSERTTKERAVKDVDKSSGSDKEAKAKGTERPKTTRGTSFSNFMFGGPPPSAMRPQTTRRSSSAASSHKPSSRRQSADMAPLSPPESEPKMADKAAKLMGTKSSKLERRQSVRSKSGAVPDPYPIDDDDMVMIHTHDKPSAVNGATEKSKAKTKTSKSKEAKSQSKKTRQDEDDDVVIVDNAGHGEPLVTSGPDDVAFVDHPPALKRSQTVPRKSTGLFGSFFGSQRPADPVRSRPRQSTLTDTEDQGLPIRTKDASKRRSRAVDGRDSLTPDGLVDANADAEARRAERRAKREAREKAEEAERVERELQRKERREREKADVEARQRKARERAKQEKEEEARRREEKRARRATREAPTRKGEGEISAEAEQQREERRRLRAQLEAEKGGDTEALKDNRRKAYLAEEEERRRRKEERRPREKGRDKADRKKSSVLVDEYHESRSGSGKGTAPPANKTSSWVDSQADQPPEIPPIEGTVLDPSGEKPRPAVDDSRDKRRTRHKGTVRGDGKSGSGGSDDRDRERDRKERRKRRDNDPADDRGSGHPGFGYEEAPLKTWDGRPTLGRSESKRRSFLGGFF